MYTIIVKDNDEKVYSAHGVRIGSVMTQVIHFVTRKYEYQKRV